MAKKKKKKAGALAKNASKNGSTKSRIEPQQALPGVEDEFEIPVEVADARDEYEKTDRARKKSVTNFKTARQELIDTMTKFGMTKLTTKNGEEDFVIDPTTKLSKKKRPKKAKTDEAETANA